MHDARHLVPGDFGLLVEIYSSCTALDLVHRGGEIAEEGVFLALIAAANPDYLSSSSSHIQAKEMVPR